MYRCFYEFLPPERTGAYTIDGALEHARAYAVECQMARERFLQDHPTQAATMRLWMVAYRARKAKWLPIDPYLRGAVLAEQWRAEGLYDPTRDRYRKTVARIVERGGLARASFKHVAALLSA